MGKGSKRRPPAVGYDKVRDNWDKVFGKKHETDGRDRDTDAKRVQDLADEQQARRNSRGFDTE
jgi:hypothetical protein